MSVTEQVMAVLSELPDEQQTTVLDFVEFLRQKKPSIAVVQQPSLKPDLEAMRSTLRQVAGFAQNAPTDLSTNPVYLAGFGQ